MDKVLRPERLDTDPSSAEAAQEWSHWKATFTNFLTSLPQENLNKRNVLINYVSPRIFSLIAATENYDRSIEILENQFVKPKNEVYSRHKLATRNQSATETVDEFLQALKTLSVDCNFQAVTADQHRQQYIRDAFVRGLRSDWIRQRLLESRDLDLDAAFDRARALEAASEHSKSYNSAETENTSFNAAVVKKSQGATNSFKGFSKTPNELKCYFCGNDKHSRSVCPAREATCFFCQKVGHFAKVCHKKKLAPVTNTDPADKVSASILPHSTIATISNCVPSSLSKASATVIINGKSVKALFDSCSSESFVSPRFVETAELQTLPCSDSVSMASSNYAVSIKKVAFATVYYQGQKYEGVRFGVLESLCNDVILGLDFQAQHRSVTFDFGGDKPSLTVCGLTTLNIPPVEPFKNLTSECRPIITKSRHYSNDDKTFIDRECRRLLKEGIIENCQSPWRAQVVVVKRDGKKRLAIDYSQTINRFTLLDAFPLPNINDLVNEIAQFRVFSTVDLKSAYHQIPLKAEDRKYTAFEASGGLYQFTRLPFGVTNGVACFQRTIMQFIEEEKLKGIFPYLDNITICGHSERDHENNLQAFFEAAKRRNLVFNESKTVLTTRKLPILGFEIEDGQIRPDPKRFEPLRQMQVPNDKKSLNRAIGFFSYYSKWIPYFSDKIKPLTQSKSFPISETAMNSFNELKSIIEQAVVTAIDEEIPFQVETDASEIALAATLTQNGKPVAFFSRMLHGSELQHSAIEKEAQAVIESIRHWRHYLTGRHFTLKTDQKSVAFMFNQKLKGKIKNDKIMRWRIDLSCYSFDIEYKPGRENVAPDTLSRLVCAVPTINSLYKLHDALCHPGVVRLSHFVRVKNLPYSVEDIKRVVASCKICCECKPKFFKPDQSHLIKATQPYERLSLDFKGPLPSNNKNRYFLCAIDEYSRFPFVFPCPDVSAHSVITSLTSLFSMFGMPAYIHSDRGTSFLSSDVQSFLREKGVATSRSTPYNPSGNGQVERYNSIVWKNITLALKSKNLPVQHWQFVLSDALHSIRSLLCTSTNETPHERFFQFSRRSTVGSSIPTWLTKPGPVLLKRHVRNLKTDPLVGEVDLLEANSHYAHVRFPDGRETTVATKHLAPFAAERTAPSPTENSPTIDTELAKDQNTSNQDLVSPSKTYAPDQPQTPSLTKEHDVSLHTEDQTVLRRSTRNRRPPERFHF